MPESAAAATTVSTSTTTSTPKPTPVAGSAASNVKKTGGKKKGLVRARGKRGGAKNRKSDSKAAIIGEGNKNSKGSKEVKEGKKKERNPSSDSKEDSTTATTTSTSSKNAKSHSKSKKSSESEPSEHSLSIGAFHMLTKQIARETDPVQKAILVKKMKDSGGLEAYQAASEKGAALGETGKWCAESLKTLEADRKEPLTLLDVGALSGTSYSKFSSFIQPTYIDLNPVGANVVKADFFTYPPPSKEDRFDVVGLSLVVNFEGDLNKRGDMLIHPHLFIKPGGYLYLVLPLACVSNSRYLTHERLRSILSSCGWNVAKQDDSKRLTRWLCKQKDGVAKSLVLVDEGKKKMGNKLGWDGKKWAKEEVKVGPRLNNFCIKLG